MRVIATPSTCAVSSLCVYRLPTVFDQDEDGLVLILDDHPDPTLHEELHRAARACPTNSIKILDSD
ncbi:ferredoxin [Streptomyces roseirectus]|uniref:Ferredoxin n=1 Tax=Streptomyces roseirectus TaxID=2768066 RepID=A0A7H0IA79_9ACTN|nr:ferredoxin [Streptomyces roseirectus]QNP69695.1 ferredoxin [Streptomyces roseirectus]